MKIKDDYKQMAIFLCVGFLTVIIDYLCYKFLSARFLVGANVAKGVGFISGMIFAYFANRYWTFSNNSPVTGSVWKFVMLYAASLCVNVALNSAVLDAFYANQFIVEVAFISATIVSALMNFLGMNFFIFSGNRRIQEDS